MGEVVVYKLPQYCIERYWHLCEQFVRDALEHSHGELGVEDVRDMAVAERVVVWMVQGMEEGILGVAVTEEVEYSRLSALRVIALGGRRLSVWGDAMSRAFARYCKSRGLTRIEAFTRQGMSRMLNGLGFKVGYVCLLKEVKGGEASGYDA